MCTSSQNRSRHLDVSQAMLVRTVWLLADPILEERSTNRHALWIKLMQKSTGVPLHAQPFEPIGAYRLQTTAVVSRRSHYWSFVLV